MLPLRFAQPELARQGHLFATDGNGLDDEDRLRVPEGAPVNVSTHTGVLKFHSLATAVAWQHGILMLPVELEYAVAPNLSLSTMVTPFGGSLGGIAINGSARVCSPRTDGCDASLAARCESYCFQYADGSRNAATVRA